MFFRNRSPGVFALGRILQGARTPHLDTDYLLALFLLVVAYFFAGKIGQQLAVPNHNVAAFWLPAGISLGVILLAGNRVWPGIFLGSLLVNITSARSILASMGVALDSTLEALVAAYLVNKFAHGMNAFFKVRDVLRFAFFAGMLAPALCATLGVSLLCAVGICRWTDFALLWSTWWIGDMLGVLLLTPFIVLLLGHEHHYLGVSELFELTLLISGLILVCVLNFGPPLVPWLLGSGSLFLCAPLLAWSALRFCPLESAGAIMVMGGFATWGSLHGFGLFGNTTRLKLYVIGLLTIGTVTTLTVAAAHVQEKRLAEEAFRAYYILKATTDTELARLRHTAESLRAELSKREGPGMQ